MDLLQLCASSMHETFIFHLQTFASHILTHQDRMPYHNNIVCIRILRRNATSCNQIWKLANESCWGCWPHDTYIHGCWGWNCRNLEHGWWVLMSLKSLPTHSGMEPWWFTTRSGWAMLRTLIVPHNAYWFDLRTCPEIWEMVNASHLFLVAWISEALWLLNCSVCCFAEHF